MNNYQRIYHCKLHTVGPIFIGNGREYTKKEYLFLDGRKSIGFVDPALFYKYLQKKGLGKKYEDFLLKEKRLDLYSWLRENRINTRDIEGLLKYRIPVGDRSLDRERARWIITECIKDAYGKPYVPGSSIKGMLRTVILSEYMRTGLDEDIRNTIVSEGRISRPGRNTFLSREAKRLEAKALNTLEKKKDNPDDAVNDFMSGVVISDSRPLEPENLILCQKLDVHTDGEEKKLNLLRECIAPGTDVEFDITVDSTLCGLTDEDIKRDIDVFDDVYENSFLRAFKGLDSLPEASVYVGGGSGFVSKTIVYPMLDKKEGIKFTMNVFEKTKVPYEHKHNRDLEYNVSPHILKCTRIDGRRYQMGLCTLEVL